jgi:uncharacterized membrane protein YhaH (DUF805 family)
MANNRLEQYVETIAAKLKSLPEAERDQQIAELQQHLQAMIADAYERGDNEESAVREAIRQFDASGRVGANLRRVGLRGRLRRTSDFVTSVLLCGALGMVYLALNTLVIPLVTGAASHPFSAGVVPAWGISLFCCLALCLSVGRRELPRRIQTQPVIREALTWLAMTGTLSFVMSCYIYSQPTVKVGLWQNVAYFIGPTLLALVRPIRTPSGTGVAAAILPSVIAYIVSFPFVYMPFFSSNSLASLVMLAFCVPMFLLFLPLIAVTVFRVRLQSEQQDWRSTRFVLK